MSTATLRPARTLPILARWRLRRLARLAQRRRHACVRLQARYVRLVERYPEAGAELGIELCPVGTLMAVAQE